MKKLKLLLIALCLISVIAFTCGLTACKTVTAHSHSWSAWTVNNENKPSATENGKATRTCSNDGCDAAATEKEYPLPALSSTDYAKSQDTATCIAGGSVTYSYNKDGVKVSFDVETKINAEAHSYGKYIYTDGTGHYKVCANNVEHKTEKKGHDKNGTDGACSVCGYKESASTPVEPEPAVTGELSPTSLTTTVMVGGGETATVNGYTVAPGYWTYSYNGAKPITVNYRYNVLGSGEVSGTVTLSSDGETNFVVCLETMATCSMILSSTEPEKFNVTLTAEFSEEDPNTAPIPEANKLTLNTQKSGSVSFFGTGYYFTAVEFGNYTLTCTSGVSLFVGSKDKETSQELPYTFSLEAGESIRFLLCAPTTDVDVDFTAIVVSTLHTHNWSSWTVSEQPKADKEGKATRTCTGVGVCNGEVNDKERTLPVLESADYSKSADSASCSAKGIITYTYKIDGENVSFNIETAKNPNKHNWKLNYTIDKAVTCQEDGSKSIHCSYCDAIKPESSIIIESHGTEHGWAEGYTIDKAVTCQEDGSKSIHCSYCDAIKPDSSIAIESHGTEHGWAEDCTEDKAATCTENGSKSIHCKVCGKIKSGSSQTIVKLNHSWGDGEVTTQPTCAAQGVKTFTCTRTGCGETRTEAVAKLEHTWDTVYTVDMPATCTADGSESIHCRDCNAIKAGTASSISKLNHDWNVGVVTKEATCTVNGEKLFACNRPNCGVTRTESLGKLGHSWNEGVVTKEATCTLEGEKLFTCTRTSCDETEIRTIAAKGHDWAEKYTEDKAATCTETGSQSIHCKVCEETKSVTEIPAKGHKWNDFYTEDVKATCTADGSESIHCSVCDAVKEGSPQAVAGSGQEHIWETEHTVDREATCALEGSESVHCSLCGTSDETTVRSIAKPDHTWKTEKTIDTLATCEEAGSKSTHCSVCDAVKEGSEEVIVKLGHSWNAGEVTTQSTCEEDGVRTFTCTNTNCNGTKTEVIPATGHDWNDEKITDKTATCTEDGSKSTHCSVCGGVKEGSDEVIVKLGHSWNDGNVTKAATCEEDGVRTFNCTRPNCGETTTESIERLGHDWGDGYITKQTTCYEKGEKTYDCKRLNCGETRTEAIEMLDHDMDGGAITTPAGCETDGVKTYSCTNPGCVHTQTELISATGHNWGEWEIELPTYLQAGEAKKVCANDTDNEHDIVVSLPVIPESGNGGYASVVADASKRYELVCTYESEHGNIAFNVLKKLTMEEAVALSVEQNGEIVEGSVRYFQDLRLETVITIDVENSFEFGDNYLHMVNKAENKEYWYNKHNGQLIAIRSKVVTEVETDGEDGPIIKKEDKTVLEKDVDAYALGEEAIFKGYAYNFFVLGAGHTERGTANFIAYLYGVATADKNGDFTQSVESVAGGTLYKFSFGLFENGNNKYFHFTEVTFTLNAENILVSAVLDTKTYVNANYSSVGNGHYKATGSYANHETFTITQSATYASGAKPVCPLDYDELFVKSFKLKNGNAEVGDSLALEVGRETTLSITDITPGSYNFTADPLTFILVGEVNGKFIETKLTDVYTDGDNGHILMYINYDRRVITLTPYVAGEFTLIVKTFATEREIKVSIPFAVPADFGAQVYKVDETQNQAEWRKYDTEFTIYAGQQLAFTSFVGVPEYENAAFTVTVGGATITDGEADGKTVKLFSAATPGEYTVTLTSVSGGKKASFKVIVKSIPAPSEILNGVYESDDSGVTVTFAPVTDGVAEGTATIVIGDNEAVAAVDYSCDSQGKINVTYKSGNSGYGFEFEITENYNLLMSYTADGTERKVYLHKEGEYARPLDGTYRLSGAANSIEHVVTLTGMYTIEYDRNCGSAADMPYTRHYEINGNPVLDVPMTVSLFLEAGDTFRIYANAPDINSGTFFYKISTIKIKERVTGITFDETEISLGINCSKTLNPIVNPLNATVKDVLWTSSDSSIVTVSGSGVITAKAVGTVTITATTVDGGFIATCTVNAITIDVERIELSEDTLYFTYDSSGCTPARIQLTVNVYPATATDKEYTYTIGDNTIVTFIQSTGYVRAFKVGTTTITFTSKSNPSVTAVCTVVVQEPVVTPTGITLDKTSQTIDKDGTFTLAATVAPDNVTDGSVTWSSSNTSVATVSENGVVTAVGEGTATIKATTCNGIEATCAVTVTVITVDPTGITLDKTAHEIKTDGSFTLSVTVAPDNVTDGSVTWSSSNTSVATVSENGVVTAVGTGTAIITATTCNGIEATCTVTVTAYVPESITLNKTSITIEEEKTETLTATVLPDKAADKAVSWSSSNPSVASVSENGVVTAVGTGSAIITATTFNGKTATCNVTVNAKGAVTLNPSEATLEVGESLYISATYSNSSLGSWGTAWSSSNTSVATVSYGNVKAVGVGSVIITATSNSDSSVSAECVITVVEAQKPDIDPTGIQLSSNSLTFGSSQLQKQMLTATILPEGATANLVWEVSPETGIIVLNDGTDAYSRNVTSVGYGFAVITVSLESNPDIKATCNVRVGALASNVSFDSSDLSFKVGTDTENRIRFSPANLADNSFTIVISDPEVVQVEHLPVSATATSVNLTFKALKVGEATVTVTMNDGSGKSAVCNVSVTEASGGEDDGTIKEGVNQISEVEVDFMMSCGYLEFNLAPGTYTFTATRDGQLIENFNFYGSAWSYAALGNSCQITVSSADTTKIKIVESGCTKTIPAFTLTIEKIS